MTMLNTAETIAARQVARWWRGYVDAMTTRRSLRTAAAVAAFTLLGVACSGGADTGDATRAVTSADAVPAGDVPEILRFTSPLVGGGELDAATLAGKPTAFWFWSPT